MQRVRAIAPHADVGRLLEELESDVELARRRRRLHDRPKSAIVRFDVLRYRLVKRQRSRWLTSLFARGEGRR